VGERANSARAPYLNTTTIELLRGVSTVRTDKLGALLADLPYYILPGGREHQLQLVSPAPSETARPVGLDRSGCVLAPSVSTQYMGVA